MMKKLLSMILCIVLALSLVPLCSAAGDNSDTLVDWNIRIAVPDNTTAVLKGNEYYIYARQEGSIPYVMLRPYNYGDAGEFIADFTDYMKQQYSDLRVTAEAVPKTVGDKRCYEIDYTYKVSGYDVSDRRIVITRDGLTYLFCSKEVEAIGLTVGCMLDDVVANCTFLGDTEKDEPAEESGLADGYLYRQNNGMPKYWLDFSGVMSDNPVLHCYFRSSDPTFYESCFILDLSTAELTENGLEIHNLQDEYGFDHSNWFYQLTFQFYLDGAIMTVERDERTLAGGSEDNILTGTYVMLPVGVESAYDAARRTMRTYPVPFEDGPYPEAELGKWAQIQYFRSTGFFPPIADVEADGDGTFSIHLYEIVDLEGFSHTATSAWYTVDAYGVGRNDITGEAVDLMG